MAKRAILNASIYLGGGEVIPRGFVIWDGSIIGGVGDASVFPGGSDVEVEDLPRMLVLPGLVDSHMHLVGYALGLKRINLAGTRSVEEALEYITIFVTQLRKGEWLRGRGWDKQRWGLEGFPDRSLLDRVTPDNPAVLSSRDGHLVWVNSRGLAHLGLDRGGIEVEGGEVETNPAGRPTGIFKEKAADLVLRQVGQAGEVDAGPAIRDACRILLAMGITGVHTSENPRSIALLDHAAGAGLIPFKTVRMLEIAEVDDIERASGIPGITHIKILADGALGSQTAAMLEPYCGQPDNYGIMAVPKPRLLALAERAVGAGFSLAVHAIGDKANRDVLDVFEQVRATGPGRKAVLRVEHAQVLRPEDVARFGKLGVIASVQPIHLVAERYWGARSRYAYAFRSILDTGGRLAFGSDAPIEDPDPRLGIHAAVTRADRVVRCPTPWYPEERITVFEAIDAYTAGAALAAGTPRAAGMISPGMPADLTVLDRDIMGPDPDTILDAQVVLTVTKGEPYYPETQP